MNPSQIVLSLYPNKRGFGYVCLDWPQKIIDSGATSVRPLCNKRLFNRFVKYVEFYKPEAIVIRDDEHISDAAQRSVKLIREITDYAATLNIPVHKYSRQQIRDVFENFGARSKYEIAQKIIEWNPELQWQHPKFRKPWMDEDYNMPVFDALALAVTHKYLTE